MARSDGKEQINDLFDGMIVWMQPFNHLLPGIPH